MEKRQVVFSSFTGEFFSSRATVNFLSFYFLLSHFRIVVDKFYFKTLYKPPLNALFTFFKNA